MASRLGRCGADERHGPSEQLHRHDSKQVCEHKFPLAVVLHGIRLVYSCQQIHARKEATLEPGMLVSGKQLPRITSRSTPSDGHLALAEGHITPLMLGRQQTLAKSIEITLQKDPSLPPVEHDSDQIHQVMLNLLLNALQAIDQNGKIRVTVNSRGNVAVVEVADSGSGIAPEHLPNIFRPFYHQGRWHRPRVIAGSPHRGGSPWPHRHHQRGWQR